MRKRHLKLTNEQKQRGIIFSSCLKGGSNRDNGTIHELKIPQTPEEWLQFEKQRNLLLNDKFFNNSGWTYNEIRS